MSHPVEIQLTEFVTHDVKRFIVTKPEGFTFEPGQGVKLAIDDENLRKEKRPFTPTSRPDDTVLEFMIKRYPQKDGVTDELHQRDSGDTLQISDPFGTIRYQGPGVFIAAGTGLTPLLSIIRNQAGESGSGLKGQTLILSNKTPRDIICEKELRDAFGDRCFLTCTRESAPGYDDRHVDRVYLSEIVENLSEKFYVCGPEEFVEDVRSALEDLGASPESIICER